MGVFSPQATAQNRPNIVMIAIDDLNNWVGYLGGPRVTPNIDRLATRSSQFFNAHATCPTCNASRTSLLTGQRPVATGIFGNSYNFRNMPGGSQRVTLPEYLRAQAEYETVEAGKIFHLPRQLGQQPDPRSDPQSWDLQNPQYIGTSGLHLYVDNNNRAFWLNGQTSGNSYLDEFAVWAEALDNDGTLQKTIWTGDWKNAEFAADYLSQYHDKPFFLAVGFGRPHLPFLAPKKYIDLIDSKYPRGVPLPFNPPEDLDDIPSQYWSNFTTDLTNLIETENELQSAIRGYLASIAFVDAAIGHVIDAVENSDYADNTIIVLFSDHGFQLGEKQRWAKFELWRQSTHVPLLIHRPGQESAVRLGQSVSLLDLYPTLIDMVGLEPNPTNSGSSLSGIMADPDSEITRSAVTNAYSWNAQRQDFSVHQNGWNYIRREDGSEELYDHNSDPNEFTNLANLAGYESRKQRLGTELFRSGARAGNRILTSLDVPTTGDLLSTDFDDGVGGLGQVPGWSTGRFGVDGLDFLTNQGQVETTRGRLVATVDDFSLESSHDFLISADVKFASGGIGAGLVFGYQDPESYFEFDLVDGGLPQNGGQDVVLRQWIGNVKTVLFSTDELPNVEYDQTYGLIVDYDSSESQLELIVLDNNRNMYFRKLLSVGIPVDSRFGIGSHYHNNAVLDNFRLLVNPELAPEPLIQVPADGCERIYDAEFFDSFDELGEAGLNSLQAGWTTQRFGLDEADLIVSDGRVQSVPGRLVATRDEPFLRAGDEFRLTSKLRFVSGGIHAGVVFGYEDEDNYYEFHLLDGGLPQSGGLDVALFRWEYGVKTVLDNATLQTHVQYGEEYTLIVDYVGENNLNLLILDETKNTYFERSYNLSLPLDSQFGITSLYHPNVDWDYFSVLIGVDVIALSEDCLKIK